VRAMHLARQMVQRGHAVTLLATSPKPFTAHKSYQQGVEVVLAPHFRDTHRGGWGWLDLPFRLGWSLQRKFDLVYAFDHKPNVVLPSYVNKVLKGRPLVSDWADWWGGKEGVNADADGFKAWVEELTEIRIRHLAGWVTAISPLLAERAVAIGLPANQVMLLPGGGDTKALRPLPQAACRKKLGLDPGRVLGVYLGLGVTDLPMLLQGLKSAGPRLGLLLLGPNESQKKNMVAAAGLQQSCVVPGRIADAELASWLSAADFGCLPLADNLANRARWPNKVGDYAAAGLPVLANPTGPLKKILAKEKAGILVPASASGFARGMKKMASSAASRRAMGRRARAWVKRDLDWSALAKRLEGFFDRVLSA